MSTTFITGITGMDGSYLAEQLLQQGHDVHGLIRRSSTFNTSRLDHIFDHPRLKLHYGEITDTAGLINLLRKHKPQEVFHLAAQSHVKVSFEIPSSTFQQTGMGTLNLLEAVRMVDPPPRVYIACSSEMFGGIPGTEPQSEETPFCPRSPYAVAKLASYWLGKNYREAYGLPISIGILFNHTGPRRHETFVTRKIAKAVARIEAGLQDELELGNLNSKRDWGFAPDYTNGMQRIIRYPGPPTEFVLGTGETHSVQEFVDRAFAIIGRDPADYVKVTPRLFRPMEVDLLQGDASKARQFLGWKPTVGFDELVSIMVEAERAALKR